MIRRLIGDGKLAARLKGNESRLVGSEQECPICFLQYTEINETKCCTALICTECYLQVKPQKEKQTVCPFCGEAKFQVSVAKSLDEEAMLQREKEEQLMEEARQRSRTLSSEARKDDDDSFGASLEKNEHVAIMRARSSSMSSDHSNPAEASDLTAIAMSPEERQELERQMKAQSEHPLSLRLQQEEAERRLQREQEYYLSVARQAEEARARREALRRALGSSGNPRSQNLSHQRLTIRDLQHMMRSGGGSDDIRSLEELFQQRQTARPRERQQENTYAGLTMSGYTEEEQLAMAIAASLRESSGQENESGGQSSEGIGDQHPSSEAEEIAASDSETPVTIEERPTGASPCGDSAEILLSSDSPGPPAPSETLSGVQEKL